MHVCLPPFNVVDNVVCTLQTEMLDGPPEYYLVSFWVLTCLQVVIVLLNLIGPCSCETRLGLPCVRVARLSHAAS